MSFTLFLSRARSLAFERKKERKKTKKLGKKTLLTPSESITLVDSSMRAPLPSTLRPGSGTGAEAETADLLLIFLGFSLVKCVSPAVVRSLADHSTATFFGSLLPNTFSLYFS